MRYIDMERLAEIEDWPPGSLKYTESEEEEHETASKQKHRTPEEWSDELEKAEAELRNPPSGKTRADILKKYGHLWSDVKEEEHETASKQKHRTPEEWKAELEKAEAELRNTPSGETRAKIFQKYSYLWSDVKEEYRRLSYEKCWYCECDTHRMVGAIDHYRPKGGITGLKKKEHPGYWWLAFDWRNWRFACDICNSRLTDLATGKVGGKGNNFPLYQEEKRIHNPSECSYYEDLQDEIPLLLDPTERADTQLLTFDREGHAQPAVECTTSLDYQRADTAIEMYNLQHTKLKRERRAIYHEIHRLVQNYQRLRQKWEQEHDRTAREQAKKALSDLGRMITPDAEYSMAARAYLKEYRSPDKAWAWVDQLLTAS